MLSITAVGLLTALPFFYFQIRLDSRQLRYFSIGQDDLKLIKKKKNVSIEKVKFVGMFDNYETSFQD